MRRKGPGPDGRMPSSPDPLRAVGPRLVCALAWLAQAGSVPVYLAHAWGGGTEDWLVRQLQDELRAGRGAVVLRAHPAPDTLWLEAHTDAGVTRAANALATLGQYMGIAPVRRVVYSSLVGAHDPLNMLGAVLRKLVPQDTFDVVFHDFFALCPSYNLLGSEGAFCGLPGPESCERCHTRLPPQGWVGPERIADWRAAWRVALDRAQSITVFSPSSKALVATVWPDLAARIDVRPHRPFARPDVVKVAGGGPVTVGVLGNIGYAKGAGVLRDLCRFVGDDFRIVVIGRIAPDHADPRLTVHGPYERREIATLARSYGVTCWFVPSIWPETFCFALHECLATGLPVYAFDLGAQADALRDAPNGRLLTLGAATLSPETFRQGQA